MLIYVVSKIKENRLEMQEAYELWEDAEYVLKREIEEEERNMSFYIASDLELYYEDGDNEALIRSASDYYECLITIRQVEI